MRIVSASNLKLHRLNLNEIESDEINSLKSQLTNIDKKPVNLNEYLKYYIDPHYYMNGGYVE